jgi:hypothetical protein
MWEDGQTTLSLEGRVRRVSPDIWKWWFFFWMGMMGGTDHGRLEVHKVWKDCGHKKLRLVGGLVDEGSLKHRLRHILTAFAMCDYTNVLLYLFLRMADPEILPMLDVRVGSTMDVRVDMTETLRCVH